jgi:hypothetical protein
MLLRAVRVLRTLVVGCDAEMQVRNYSGRSGNADQTMPEPVEIKNE